MNIRQTEDQITSQIQQEKLLRIESPSSSKPAPLWLSKRFLVTILMFACYVNVNFLRCNISIALVEMTSNKSVETENSTTIQVEYAWDSTTGGFVLSAFYYGGLCSLMSGYVVAKLGGAISCGLSLMLCGTLTVLHPISLYQEFSLFLVIRFLTGLSESFLLVSVSQICTNWIPENEKSKLVSFAVSGINVGNGVVHGFCAFLAHRWGWQMIFYVTGAISLMTSFLCFTFVRNQPSEDRWISKKELAYILEGTTVTTRRKVAHPYKRILLSGPVWALNISQFALLWMWAILSSLLPLYVKDVTQDDINTVGLISSVPNMVSIIMVPICGILLDYTKKFDITQTKIHKILMSGTLTLIGVLLLGTVLISNFVVSVISFVLLQMLLSMISLITKILIISIAPNSTSVIAALSAFVFALSCIMARSATGFMTTNHTLKEWNHVFILSGGISLFSAVIFAGYGSSEAQSWSTSLETITSNEPIVHVINRKDVKS